MHSRLRDSVSDPGIAGVLCTGILVLLLTATVDAQTLAYLTGSSSPGQDGVYGTMGVPAVANTPGARQYTVEWSDPASTVWIFGGYGYSSGSPGCLNDLWKYDALTGMWTWMKGSNLSDQLGTYGTLNLPSSGNAPGGRYRSVSWRDTSGSLWLYGGYGFPKSGGPGKLSDLWKYDPSSGTWTWVNGSDQINIAPTHGTLRVFDASNTPGCREGASSWADASGNLWLFGGVSLFGHMNDLWKYSIAENKWAWMHGSSSQGQPGTYGTMGEAGPTNTPGGRISAAATVDTSGCLWLFGGQGYDYSGSGPADLNDMWKYDPLLGTGYWTWMKGSNASAQYGVYGTKGVGTSTNTPGARVYSAFWTDTTGTLWLFGGTGFAASTTGYLNDLWAFDPVSGNWTWMKGSSLPNQSGTFGTRGAASASNIPGGRYSSAGARIASTLFEFGGGGYGAGAPTGYLNDFWAIYLNDSDSAAPTVTGGQTSGSRSITLSFSEAMETSAALPANYTLSGTGMGGLSATPDSVTWVNGNMYRLDWTAGAFGSGDITIMVSALLKDVTGQAMGTPRSWTTAVPVSLSSFRIE